MAQTMPEPLFELSLASGPDDLAKAQRLRYAVFVEELGGDGPLVDHAARREADRFDPYFDHLILRDRNRPGDDDVVGVYRVLRCEAARGAGGFYSADEYNLSPLLDSGRRLMELGRSCIHRAYRGGMAMFQLWTGLADYVRQHEIDILFGVASFHGTDPDALAAPLSILHHRHLAPPELRVTARPPGAVAMDRVPEAQVDRAAAMRAVPPLIKAYLRLGGFVGQGAFVDRDFNTTDVCLVIDTERMNAAQAARYTGPRP